MPDQEETRRGESQRPVLRFLIIFGVLIGVFYAIYIPFSHSDTYHVFLGLIAHAASLVLGILGSDTTVLGQTIQSTPLDMDIVPGCDGMEALGLFSSAVLASPVSIRYRLTFLFPGIVVLSIVNLIRIVSLYYIGVYRTDWLDLMHWDIWPGILVVAILSCWMVWARWAWQREGATADEER